MRLKGDAYVYIFVMALALFMILWSTFGSEHDYESKLLPWTIGGLALLLSAIGLNKSLKTPREATVEKKEELLARENWRGYMINLGWVVGFLLGVFFIGYLFTIPLFVLAYVKRLGGRWLTAVVIAVLTTGLIYVGFEVALQLELYRGLLGDWPGF